MQRERRIATQSRGGCRPWSEVPKEGHAGTSKGMKTKSASRRKSRGSICASRTQMESINRLLALNLILDSVGALGVFRLVI